MSSKRWTRVAVTQFNQCHHACNSAVHNMNSLNLALPKKSGAPLDASRDASDGLATQVADDVQKLLKRLGYPGVEDPSKPSGVLTRARTSVAKRLAKLHDMLESMKEIAKPSPLVQKLFPQYGN